MSRFNIKKAQSGFEGWSGEQKILAEQGEVFKTPDGQIQKISNNAPSHDDEMKINKFGINKVNKGDGGVEIYADSVLSDSQRQVNNGKRINSIKEEIVKITSNEGVDIANQLGLNIKLKKSISPSQLFLEIQKVKDKQVLKILGKSKNFINNRESANSNNINRSQISALPTDEEIYDAIFDYVENKKDESGIDFNEEVQAQYGESTYVQKPYSPFQIQKNQRDIFEEEWKKRQTYLSPTKQKSPAVQQYYKNEQAKKEANERINNRQNITNAVGMALAPVPVIGEVYNSGNTIANLLVDAAQGEYIDAAASLIPYGLSKISFVKNFTNNSKSPYNKNIGNYQKVLDRGEDIHDVRLKYHNNQLLDFDELSLLNLEGKGNPVNYKGVETRDKLGLSQTKNQKPLKVNKNNFIDELFGEDYSKVDTNINSSHNKNPNIESNVPAKHDFVAEEKNINYKNTLDFLNYNKIKPYQRTTTTRSADKWISDWYSNPETKKKFIDYGGTEEEWEQVLNSLENPILSGYNWGENRPLGLYSSKINKASVPLNSSVDAAVHEGIHKTKINLDSDFPMLPKLWNDLTDAVSEIPSEVYPELGRMRYNLKLKPKQNITMKQLDKGLETIMDGYNIPFKIKDKDKLLDIVNKMPSIVPLGVASEMSQQNKQYGGEINSLLSSLNLIPKGQYSTSIQRPINPFQIQKNQKEILAEELKKRQTYLSPKKQNNPNREYWERENLKKEANERINTRQDQTNMLGLALSPVPVLGEIYNTANTIANGMVDAAQGEYTDAVMSTIPMSYSYTKPFLNKTGMKIALSEIEGRISKIPEKTRRFQQMRDYGITFNQRKAYNPVISESLNTLIPPFGYPDKYSNYSEIIKDNLLSGGWKNNKNLKENILPRFVNKTEIDARDDSWKLYLGIPQKNNTYAYIGKNNNKDMFIYDNYNLHHKINPERVTEEGKIMYKSHTPMGGFSSSEEIFPRIYVKKDKNDKIIDIQTDKESIQEVYKDDWDLEFKNIKLDDYIGKPFTTVGTLDNPIEDDYYHVFYNPEIKKQLKKDLEKYRTKKQQFGGNDSILSQLGLIEKLPKAQSGVTTNPRDFLYTKEELNGNDYRINKRLEQCKTGNCLEETNLYFDKYVSPILSIPNSNELKEKYNISSGRNHSRYNEYGESADSWDIHGLLKEKGHVNYTGEDVNKVDLNSLPIGTLLGYGENESVNNAYNKKKNLSSSRHSARVVGYDEKGIPIVYDYNQLLRIGDSGLGFKLNNITIPNEYKKYTRKYLADNNLLEEKITPLKINYKGKANYDEDEFLPFKDTLETFKDQYMDVLGISNKSYDEFARQAVAMALAESKGGDDTIIRMKGIIPIPTYWTERFNPFAKTKGITQLNVDNLFKDERIAKRLKALNIREDNYDPYNSKHIVPATLLYLKYINSELDKNTTPLSRIEKVAYRNVAPKFFKKKPNEAKGDFKPVKNYKKEYDAIELK